MKKLLGFSAAGALAPLSFSANAFGFGHFGHSGGGAFGLLLVIVLVLAVVAVVRTSERR